MLLGTRLHRLLPQVSAVADSRAGSGRKSAASSGSSKPTSAISSKSSSAHRRLRDPLSYDPKVGTTGSSIRRYNTSVWNYIFYYYLFTSSNS